MSESVTKEGVAAICLCTREEIARDLATAKGSGVLAAYHAWRSPKRVKR